MQLLPLLQPRLHGPDFFLLRILHRLGRQIWCCDIRVQAILIPVMNTMLDQNEGLASRRFPVRSANPVRRCGSPRIGSTIDDGDAWVAEVHAAQFVHGFDIRKGGDVEGSAAEGGGIVQVDETRDQGELILWYTRARLEVTPSIEVSKYSLPLQSREPLTECMSGTSNSAPCSGGHQYCRNSSGSLPCNIPQRSSLHKPPACRSAGMTAHSRCSSASGW